MTCHKISNLVPVNDDTVMACNAGQQKAKHKIQIITTKYRLAQPPLIPMGIYKRVLHNVQYPDCCNVDQGFIKLTTSHTQKQKQAVNMTCNHPSLLTKP